MSGLEDECPRGLARISAALAVAAFVAHPHVVWAQQDLFNVGPSLTPASSSADVHAGLAHTTNAQLVNQGGSADNIASVGMDIDARRSGTLLTMQAQGSLDWLEYLSHSFRSLPQGSLTGMALLGNNTDIVQFGVRDSFSQSSPDPFEVSTPNNIENVNVLTAGPALNFHLDTATRLTLTGIYARTTYQNSDVDSQSYTGGLTLSHALAQSSQVALNVSDQDVSYLSANYAGFHLKTATVSYSTVGRRTALTLEAGYSIVDQLGSSDKGFTTRVALQRMLSGSSTVYLNAGQAFETSADLVGVSNFSGFAQGSPPGVNTSLLISTANPFQDQSAEVGWRFARLRTALQLSAGWEHQRYTRDSLYDHTLYQTRATVSRRLSPTLAVALSGWLIHERYENENFDDSQSAVAFQLAKSLGPRVSLAFFAERARRSGSPPLQDYIDNIVGVQIAYSLFGSAMPGRVGGMMPAMIP